MRASRFVATFVLLAGSVGVAQVGRGWSDWPTPYADAQRTSWLRTDPKISVDAMAAPGFALQWTSRLDNERRSGQGLTQGVTASGVTLFVPTSLIAGSSNTLHLVDNDTGYIIWSRRFEGALPPPTAACGGGITAAPTHLVSATAPVASEQAAALAAARGNQGYRSLLGEPGQGVPVEPRGGGPGRGGGGAPGAGGGGGQGRAPSAGIPGAPNVVAGGLGRAIVGYVVAADGQLHVVGLQSGKDLQKPAPFVPANSRWSNPVAAGTMMYASTAGNCGGAPNGVFAIDLDAPDKPVVSFRTAGSVVGPVAFSSDGKTLLAAIGAGTATGDGTANAIVALDPKTLRLKDWFTQPTADFVTGPTVFRHGTKDVVAAATKDGRVMLLDSGALGGASHATPLLMSRPLVQKGGSIPAESLSTWARPGAGGAAEMRWLLVPISGQPAGARSTNGPVRNGAVIALRLTETKSGFSLEPQWTSTDLLTPATPMTVNGVVFALSTGRSAAGRTGGPAALYAYDGQSGKALWNSGSSMTAPAAPGSYWSALSQVYVGADDGTVYAFGFLDERR